VEHAYRRPSPQQPNIVFYRAAVEVLVAGRAELGESLSTFYFPSRIPETLPRRSSPEQRRVSPPVPPLLSKSVQNIPGIQHQFTPFRARI